MKKSVLIVLVSLLLVFVGYLGLTVDQMARGVQADREEFVSHPEAVHLDYLNKKAIPILTETKLGAIDLFELNGENIITNLQGEFLDLEITKQVGQQDGPDFIFYSLSKKKEELAYVSMDSEDSNQVQSLTILSAEIVDVYGLKVGMSADKLSSTRNSIIFNADLHMNIYAKVKNSNILYRLSGDLINLNDSTYVSENYSVENWQTSKMKIESISWQKEN